MTTAREVHAELLLGRRTRDVNGEVVGRIEEMHVEVRNGEHVVTEFHLGPAATLERWALSARQLPFLRLLPFGAREDYTVSWKQMDLSDPDRPRVRVPKSEIARREVRRE